MSPTPPGRPPSPPQAVRPAIRSDVATATVGGRRPGRLLYHGLPLGMWGRACKPGARGGAPAAPPRGSGVVPRTRFAASRYGRGPGQPRATLRRANPSKGGDSELRGFRDHNRDARRAPSDPGVDPGGDRFAGVQTNPVGHDQALSVDTHAAA